MSSAIRSKALFLATAGLLLSGLCAQGPGNPAAIDFDRDVRPILADRCFKCHGPDAETRKAGLRLDLREHATGAGKSGRKAIVPGDSAGSELVRRIHHRDPKERMPPPSAKQQLTDEERQLLVQWIDQGAPWAEHWAFVPPRVPELPPGTATDPIDRFVLARLESAGLRPAPAADRRTLLRRVTLDLTGLPPTPAELTGFLADESPDAYERVVDRLLASPHYGEHMARYWLDAARYGDTHGLHLDNYREMWPYRDWVVRAFQDNLPFDRFTIEQLAGDLLPCADPDRQLDLLIASGFNRCHITTAEGGSIEEEVYVRNVVDRVSTTGTVFLGLTLGCAVCHDHKFDPVSQQEFYQLFAFFNNLDGAPMDGNKKDPAPVLKIPSASQRLQLAELDTERQAIATKIDAVVRETRYREPPDPAADPAADPAPRRSVVWVDDELPPGATAEGDGLHWVEAPAPVHQGHRSMQRRSRGNQQHFFKVADRKLRVGAGDTLFAWVYLDPQDPPEQIMLQWNDDGAAGWNHRAYWGKNKIPYGKDGTAARRRIGDLPQAGAWTRLAVPAVAVGLWPGFAVHGVAFTQFGGTAYWDTVGIDTASPQEPEDYPWLDDDTPRGAELTGDGRTWQWVTPAQGEGPAPVSGPRVLRRRGKGLNQDVLTRAPVPLRVQDGDRLFAYVWLDPEDPPRSVQLQFFAGNWEHRARWGAPAHGADRPGGADHVAGPLPGTGAWVRLEVPIAAVDLAPGARITGWAFTQVDGTVYWDRAGVRTWGPPSDRHLRSRLAWEALAADDATVPAEVRAALAKPPAERSAVEDRSILDHYLRHVFAGTRERIAPLEQQLAEVAKRRTQVEQRIPTTLVMKERKEPRPAYLLRRGQYDQRGPQVQRRTPAALPPMPDDLPRDRLGLARWLVDPAHPLTARVTVNRFWQQLFGTGLVKTSEDFGNQGERPSHPELLDWLATRFIADGWDVKQLMKRMVLSATYRQSSRVTPELLRRDPENRLLARGPRFRLDGETLRDQALALSGLLVPAIGGPGVKPPQPAGLWKAVGYSSSNTARFTADKGHEKVHRRSLYTFWKRTAPPPQMTIFDAPSREECRVRRERTNTPLQALVLMNDPQFVECARALAERILTEGGDDDRQKVRWALALATCQEPRPADVADLLELLRLERETFAGGPDAAHKLITIGESAPERHPPAELAAWTLVANLILNLDAVLTKG